MSEHTQGRIKAIRWVDGLSALRPEESSGRYFGGAPVVDLVGGLMTDGNARRLTAAWNAFEGVRTEFIESMAGTGAMQAAGDSMSALPAAQAELNAARALLREVMDAVDSRAKEYKDRGLEVAEVPEIARVRNYLDACDTLEGNKPVEATGCRECGDILPAGHYCKAPACPLNPQMKGK